MWCTLATPRRLQDLIPLAAYIYAVNRLEESKAAEEATAANSTPQS